MDTFKSNNFSREFQIEILSCLIHSRKFLRESLGLIKPEYFDNQIHMMACKGIYDIYLKIKHPPSRTSLLHSMSEQMIKAVRVRDQDQKEKFILKPITKLLDKIYAPLSSSGEYVRSSALKFARVQSFKRTLLDAYEDLEKEADPDQAKELLYKRMRQLDGLEHGGSNFFQSYEKLHELLDQDKSRCAKTGFKKLDRWMGGGPDPGTETVFMAPPKFGKSMILVNVGFANLLRRKVVIHFTLEINELKIMFRYAKRIARMTSHKAMDDPREFKERIKSFYALHKGELYVKGYPPKAATVETLKSYVYWLINRKNVKPDLILVDYGDLLRSHNIKDRNVDNERLIQGDVYEGLRAMAQEFDCPLVTASQCNRAAASKPIIHMEDIAESYQKCMIADHIIAICGTEEERQKKRLRLFFAGSREAETGSSLRIEFDWDTSRMSQVKKKKEEEGHD